MRNFCSNCGAKIEENARFCGNCGRPLTDGSTAQNIAAPFPSETVKETPKQTGARNSGLIVIAVIAVIALAAFFVFRGFGGAGNALVGTWALQSANGRTDSYKIGKTVTLNSSGKLYDNDNIISGYLNDEYTLNSWESASGVLYFSGVFGTSCQARYSISGNTLTLNAGGDKLVFRKR